jgi:long-chain acyl-CoA synthetase
MRVTRKYSVLAPDSQSLQTLIERLPSFGSRQAVGLRREFGIRWWSYQRLYEESCRVARLLRKLGLERGDRMLLWAPNSPEWASFLFGAVLRGIIVVPIDEASQPDFVARVAQQVQAKLLVHGLEQSCEALSLITQSIYLPEEERTSDEADEEMPVRAHPDDTALILYTSGTTSEPKGVILTHRNLMSQVARFRRWRRLVRFVQFRQLSVIPLSHVFGLTVGLCVPLSVGLSVLYTCSVSAAHLIRTIKDNRITLLATVPRVLQLLGKTVRQSSPGRRKKRIEEELHAIRRAWWRRHITFMRTRAVLGHRFSVIVVGGATLPREDEQFWRDGYILIQGYGSTETTAIASFTSPFSRRVGSIGKSKDKETMRIADDGEILVRGPNVTPGYYGETESGVEALSEGFYRTGDRAGLDARKRLYFLGRKKEIIVISEGFNVYPQDVESVLNRQPGVLESVVLGLAREGHEEVHAVLLLSNGTDPSLIIRSANAQLHRHQMILGWSVWPDREFPRAGLFKINRGEVERRVKRLQEQQEEEVSVNVREASTAPSLETILATADHEQRLQMVVQYLTEAAPEVLASSRARLIYDLGLSSIDMVRLLFLLEQRWQVALSGASLSQESTLADIYALYRQPQTGYPLHSTYAKTPRWASLPALTIPRVFLQPLLFPAFFASKAKLSVSGLDQLDGIKPPFIIAGLQHHHALDVFAIYSALPDSLRRKLAVVSGSWVFREYFEPAPDVGLMKRMVVAGAFYFGIPAFFPFAVLPQFGATREGLLEICRLIDRGFSTIIFPAHFPNLCSGLQSGIALLAVETQVPIVPLCFEGNKEVSFVPRMRWSRVSVKFGKPLLPTPGMTPAQIIEELNERIESLS